MPLTTYQSKYFGAIIIETSLVARGAAVALPPFILVSVGKANDQDLLRHEYGHLIQFLIFCIFFCSFTFGYIFYLAAIGLPSVASAYYASKYPAYIHQSLYTEKFANQISYWVFCKIGKGKAWNYIQYPVYWK